jgi:hypothetical protein
MMVAQVALVTLIILICLRFLASPNSLQTKAWKKILLIFFTISAIIAVFFPDITNKIANAVGIGRGADLLLYVLTMAFIFEQVNRYIKQKDEQKRQVTLARQIALLEATIRDNSI